MIDWNRVYKLSPGEFSEDPNKYAEENLIYYLGRLRKKIKRKMRPSPVSGALARFDEKSSTSMHFCSLSHSRKSKASDMFIEGVPFVIFSTILDLRLFNGIGIYLDTKGPDGLPWIMFHLDLRKRNKNLPTIWIVEKVYDFENHKLIDTYRYPQADTKYWSLLNDQQFYKDKKYGV